MGTDEAFIDAAAIEVLTPPEDYFGAKLDLIKQGWGQTFNVNRDSNIRQQSNWDTIVKLFDEKFEKYEDWRVESSNHWAVGWLDTMMVRILKCKCTELTENDLPLIVRHPDWESKGNKTWLCHTCNSTAQYTPIFSEALEIRARLENYPILDEEDLSRRESEDLWEYLKQEVGEEHAEALSQHLSEEYNISTSEDVKYEWITAWKEENIKDDESSD